MVSGGVVASVASVVAWCAMVCNGVRWCGGAVCAILLHGDAV